MINAIAMETDPQSLFVEGRLSEAVASAIVGVKNKPRDMQRRTFLVELLCFLGEFDRARAQLDVLAKLSHENSAGAEHFNRLIAGEQMRRQVLAGAKPVLWLADPTEATELLAVGLLRLNGGQMAKAAACFSRAELARSPVAGNCNGVAFDDFRDLDDRLGSVIELVSEVGEYGWLPVKEVAQIKFRPTQLARDLIWRSARVQTRNGKTQQVFLPALYPTMSSESDLLKLGRETGWTTPAEGLYIGTGRKLLLLGDQDHDVLQISQLEFGVPS